MGHHRDPRAQGRLSTLNRLCSAELGSSGSRAPAKPAPVCARGAGGAPCSTRRPPRSSAGGRVNRNLLEDAAVDQLTTCTGQPSALKVPDLSRGCTDGSFDHPEDTRVADNKPPTASDRDLPQTSADTIRELLPGLTAVGKLSQLATAPAFQPTGIRQLNLGRRHARPGIASTFPKARVDLDPAQIAVPHHDPRRVQSSALIARHDTRGVGHLSRAAGQGR